MLERSSFSVDCTGPGEDALMSTDLQLLEALAAAVYVTDADGRITFYNQAAADLWGHRPALGSLWCGSWRIYHPDGRHMPHDECPMALTLKEGRPIRGREAILERPDGSRTAFRPFPTPLRDETGRITGAINMLVDVSDRHRAATESERLAAIVSSSDDAIISKTLDGRITTWNAGATRIFGYEAEEMIGQPITRIIPPDRLQEEKDILARLSAGERIEHYETRRVAKDGRLIDISLTVSPLRDWTGKVVGASKVARDITERRRAEEVQELLVNELNHRIKNTLATVQALATQTFRRTNNPAEFVKNFNGRIDSLSRAHRLLTASSFQSADVAQLIRDQSLVGSGDESRISLSGPSVMLDAQAALHLALVLHELGTNARKYGSLSVSTGKVSIAWEMRTNGKRELLVTWRETGGPAVKAPSAQGFGTTLIHQSLRAHGGEATIRYAEDGVTCTLRFPLAEMAQSLTQAKPEAAGMGRTHRTESGRSRLTGKRVLLVEDEALLSMVLVDYLTEAGCVVVGPAHTVDKAAALINEATFDAALLDVNLSGRTSQDLALALTQKGVPFAFVTGYGREGLPTTFRQALMVEKPFTESLVLGAVEQLLNKTGNISSLQSRRSDAF
jgi:PAS domain S-box-containing protein